MTRKPAAPSNLRNGLKWRDGRPRWEPSPANRACGFAGMDLRDHEGRWMERGAATTAADARTLWAKLVREAMRDDVEGSKARGMLAAALERLPVARPEPEHQHSRALVADLIERGRAVLEAREPELAAGTYGPRTVKAMIEGFFADARAMSRISAGTQRAYRIQSKKLEARFGDRRVDELTLPQMRGWYLDMQRDVSTSTANVAVGAAGAMFQWAIWQDPQWLKVSPLIGLGRDKAAGRRVFWTMEEERDFVRWCDANGYVDVADAVVACLWTGARQIDVTKAGLQELERPTWRFIPQKTERKGQEALPGLLEPIQRRVARRRAEANADPVRHLNDPPYLWDRRHGRRHTSASIGERFREARKAAIADGALPEDFLAKRLQDTRDTCVTRLAAADVSLERIASWGGWAVETAKDILREHYLSLLDESALETADKLRAWALAQGLDVAAA
jgi:hypothetical protein